MKKFWGYLRLLCESFTEARQLQADWFAREQRGRDGLHRHMPIGTSEIDRIERRNEYYRSQAGL